MRSMRKVNDNPERFQHVRAAAAAGDRPVPVLRHADSACRGHQRDRRGHVECAVAVAAGSARVKQRLVTPQGLRAGSRLPQPFGRVRAHDLGESHQFLRLLALVPQSRKECHDFRVRHRTRQKPLHHRPCLGAAEIVVLFDLLDGLADLHVFRFQCSIVPSRRNDARCKWAGHFLNCHIP